MVRNIENLRRWNRAYYRIKKLDPLYVKRKRESTHKYYERHKEQCLKQRRIYFEKNKNKCRAYRREWKKNTPNGIYQTLKSLCKKKNIKLGLTQAEFIAWWDKQKKM